MTITYLNTDRKEIFLLTLLKLLQGLSLLSSHLANEYTKRTEMISNISKNNKIRRIILPKVCDMVEIDLFINLCPCMEYLHIEHMSRTDLLSLL
ncbi:hypothetical protein I4U23_023020 [Adineta vaga]|nr:hypothetical protein I4U23_023020 [Adineta vaga]